MVEMRMMLAVKIEEGIELFFSWLQFVCLCVCLLYGNWYLVYGIWNMVRYVV